MYKTCSDGTLVTSITFWLKRNSFHFLVMITYYNILNQFYCLDDVKKVYL